VDPKTGKKKRVNVSVIEAFGGDSNSDPVREVEDVLRLEYRNKLLNPKWRDAMLDSGGGANEISQRMAAMLSDTFVEWHTHSQLCNMF
jgi:magnesium chelatase subunit H